VRCGASGLVTAALAAALVQTERLSLPMTGWIRGRPRLFDASTDRVYELQSRLDAAGNRANLGMSSKRTQYEERHLRLETGMFRPVLQQIPVSTARCRCLTAIVRTRVSHCPSRRNDTCQCLASQAADRLIGVGMLTPLLPASGVWLSRVHRPCLVVVFHPAIRENSTRRCIGCS